MALALDFTIIPPSVFRSLFPLPPAFSIHIICISGVAIPVFSFFFLKKGVEGGGTGRGGRRRAGQIFYYYRSLRLLLLYLMGLAWLVA